MSATNHDADARTEAKTEDSSDRERPPAELVQELPPSSKLVYKVLEYEGSMTQEEIATESRLCPRTVRYALGKLDDDGIVHSRVHLEDARQSVYRLADE